jgi:hypothetical protein
LSDVTDKKFMLRGVVKMNVLSGLELAMTAKDIATEDVPDSVFEIPARYQEVKPPPARGGN